MTVITALTDPNELPNQSQDQQAFDSKMGKYFADLPLRAQQENALAAGLDVIAAGGAYTLSYVFDTATADTDPGAGKLRLNNATQQSATGIRSSTTSNGANVASILDVFDDSTSVVKGSIKLTKRLDASKWLTFNLTAVATPAGYRNITVVCTGYSGANPFAKDDALLLTFTRTGDKGDTGALNTQPIIYVRDEKASGTGAGAYLGGWAVRTLNTVKANTIGAGASLASNRVTLPAGTYEYVGSAPAYNCLQHQARLYNVTAAAVIDPGTSEYSSTVDTRPGRSILRGTFSLSASSSIEIQHAMADGGGQYGYQASRGVNEVYAELFIKKVS